MVNIGIKGWYNSWESGGIESDALVLMLGPSAGLTYGKWFGGISYLVTMQDYKFSNLDTGFDLKVDRSELDLTAGYMFHPRVGILAGYKYISGDGDIIAIPWEYSLSGLVFGVTANYPIKDVPLTIFGSLSYLIGEVELSLLGVSETDDVTGTSLDLGVAYAISEKVSANVGYKHQSFEYEGGGEDIFSALTIGLNYAF